MGNTFGIKPINKPYFIVHEEIAGPARWLSPELTGYTI